MQWLNKKYTGLLFFLVLCLFLWPVGDVFSSSYSKVIYDNKGQPLRIFIAEDEQFRFSPQLNVLPQKYMIALTEFEDRYFNWHPGVNPFPVVRAFLQNIAKGKRVSGASTITMQTARLSNPQPRNYWNKVKECFLAIRLTIYYSKQEILEMYSAHVPMGSNVVGVESAAWIYFKSSLMEITWAQAALLAILPNAPSLLNLESKRPLLLKKRNRLLRRLREQSHISDSELLTSIKEPLPSGQKYLPFFAPQFTQKKAKHKSFHIHTTLDRQVQKSVEELAEPYSQKMKNLGIHNLAVLVVDTKSGEVKSYLGSQNYFDPLQGQVDGVKARRSTGSLLKPFLVERILKQGPFTLDSKIQDVPTHYGAFSPQNAHKNFRGLADLKETLVHSLNVPSIRLLNYYGVEKFYFDLQRWGLKGLFRMPSEYGLPLILGGAEASLWELVQMYTHLANYGDAKWLVDQPEAIRNPKSQLMDSLASYQVIETLSQLYRPGSEFYWQDFGSEQIAWKTGTSYGQKDAWAIGLNPKWVVGVWVGNFTGEGNAESGGAKTAAPLLFQVLRTLQPAEEWFSKPFAGETMKVCSQSGYMASKHCLTTKSIEIPTERSKHLSCPYHQSFWVDDASMEQINSSCWKDKKRKKISRYILPAKVRKIFDKRGFDFDVIPKIHHECQMHSENTVFIEYPTYGLKIHSPVDYNGQREKLILKASHSRKHGKLFWFLNNEFWDSTIDHHNLEISLAPGSYSLLVQDEEGGTAGVDFRVYH